MLQYFETLQDQSGNALPLDGIATVIVTTYPGGGAATIYASNSTASPIAGSTVTADVTGQISFFAPDGAYILTYQVNGTTYKVKSPVQIIDPMGFVTATDTGTANTYVVNNAAYPTSLYVGLKIEVLIAHNNTGASTFNLNSTGAQSITGVGGAVLSPGQLTVGAVYRLEWLGSTWQLFSSTGSFALGPGDVRNFGAVVGVDCTGAVSVDAAANNPVIFPQGAWVISSLPTIPAGVVVTSLPGSTFTGAGAAALDLTQIAYYQYNVVEGTAAGGAFQSVQSIAHTYGGSGMSGGRTSILVNASLAAASSPSNPNRNYVAGAFQMNCVANDNGTNPTTAGTAAGAGFGINAVCILSSTATAWLNASCGEFNIACQAGSSVYYRSGIQICELASSAVQGSIYDGALSISRQTGGIGWQNCILFSNANGSHPTTPSGQLIATQGAYTTLNGVNLTSYTFTGVSFAALGFAVQGVGTQLDLGIGSGFHQTLHHTSGGAAYDTRIVSAVGTGVTGAGTLTLNCGALGFFGSSSGQAAPTGYGTPTGGSHQASFAAGAITLPNLAAAVAQLIVDLKGYPLLAA